MERKKEVVGYYHDGEKSWILYQDEDGNQTQEEWKDEQSRYTAGQLIKFSFDYAIIDRAYART